jgi:hypothetical protein
MKESEEKIVLEVVIPAAPYTALSRDKDTEEMI